jgi:two-component system, OmpR family, sensor histidine kinase CiaH
MKDVFTPIRWRLVGWNLLVLATILLSLGWATYLALSRSLMDETDRTLAAQAQTVGSRVGEERTEGRPHLDEESAYSGGLFYLMMGPNGQILSNPQRVDLGSDSLRLSSRSFPHYETSSISGDPVRLYVQPLSGMGTDGLALVVGQSVQSQQNILATLLLVLLVGSGAGLALSLVGAWFLAGRALVPIQEALRRQQQFIADASHELRTPLTVLHAATDLLHQHRDQPMEANVDLLQDVRGEIGRMERLVGDLLTLARSDLGEIDLATGRLDLRLLSGEVARLVGPLAEERGIRLESQDGGTSLLVEADPDRLQQLLLILLDNALKHTPSGGKVTIAIRRRGPMGCVEVVDTGSGIPRDQLPKVFDRFYRVEKARSRGQGGAGLGLSIARSLAEAHGGQLTLESAPGAGTTARLCLKLEREGSRTQGQA